MLARPSCVLRAVSSGRRYYSEVSSVPKYHRKVRAIPFAFSQDAAVTHVGVHVSSALLLPSEDDAYSPAANFFSSFLAKHLPSTGFKTLQPDRIQAVYFPAWIVDAEVEAKACFDEDSEDFQNSLVFCRNSYLPGSEMDLARVPLLDRSVDIEVARPFSDHLLHQHGSEVVCLPYKITPLDIIEKARKMSFKQATIDDDIRFDPRSLKCDFLAAYPVLIPIYVAQYIPPEPYFPLTVIIEAHSKPGRHYLHVVTSLNKSANFLQDLQDEGEDYVRHGKDSSPIDVCITPTRSGMYASDELCSWLREKMGERDTPVSLVSEQAIDMNDPRVRPWTSKEVEPVRKWLKLGERISDMKDKLKFISSIDPNVKVIEFPPRLGSQDRLVSGLEGFFKAEAEKLQKLEEIRLAEAPEWWRRWKASQTPKA
ncbi:hypothetical protein F5I97DRAFT_1929552 [Phlebopus sp. FC_14]|nr:hypothetical protein F5I97DRAFT_1929552 [Phlebopus sp. FC_14]